MMDDFKPKKPVSPARINRVAATTKEPAIDEEIGAAFVPPDQIAASDQAAEVDDTIIIDSDETEDPAVKDGEKPAKKDLKSAANTKAKQAWHWWPPKIWVKKQWFIVGGAVLALVILALVLVLVVFKKSPVKPGAPKKAVVVAPAKPKTVASRLTGLQVTPAQSQLPVTGVMIENSIDARPQSGLDQAGVVYEAVAEGGVTRFLALFEDNQPDYVGPIRSARPYYIRWLLPFDAAYAHVGGSPDALSDISALGVKDLNQFYNGDYYQRISSRDAPHNVYTSLSQLISLEKAKHYDTSNFTGFPRKAEAPSKTPNVTSIDFTISGPVYSVHYDYNPITNSYNRSVGGAPHMVVDKAGNSLQLSPKVVIALVMSQSNGALDASGAYYTEYDTVGSGQMYVFQDGTVTPGTWNKATDTSQFTFTDSTGKTLPLNPGQTWISVVGLAGDVSYK